MVDEILNNEENEVEIKIKTFDELCALVDKMWGEEAEIELKRTVTSEEDADEVTSYWSISIVSSVEARVEVADPEREVAINMAMAAVQACLNSD